MLGRDKVTIIKATGNKLENVTAEVQARKIFFDDGLLPIEEGDRVERILPNGLVEVYEVTERGYFDRPHPHGSYQSTVRKITASTTRTNVTTVIYNISGSNTRLNINSTDTSTNVVNVGTDQLFDRLRDEIIRQVANDDARDALLERVRELNEAVGTQTFAQKYQQLLSIAADHMTVLLPFLPALTQLLQ
jgi:hypothetical protein